MLTEKDVDHVARLARLALTDEERKKYLAQLSRILDHIQTLSAHDTSNVVPTHHVVPLANVWREDVAVPFDDREGLLANAPEREDVFFKVRKVIE